VKITIGFFAITFFAFLLIGGDVNADEARFAGRVIDLKYELEKEIPVERELIADFFSRGETKNDANKVLLQHRRLTELSSTQKLACINLEKQRLTELGLRTLSYCRGPFVPHYHEWGNFESTGWTIVSVQESQCGAFAKRLLTKSPPSKDGRITQEQLALIIPLGELARCKRTYPNLYTKK
jgi:hypothetical protein